MLLACELKLMIRLWAYFYMDIVVLAEHENGSVDYVLTLLRNGAGNQDKTQIVFEKSLGAKCFSCTDKNGLLKYDINQNSGLSLIKDSYNEGPYVKFNLN